MADARRRTTLEERKEIVEYCIAHDKDYKGTAARYDVSYSQVYNWVRKYLSEGEESLVDKRGHHKTDDEVDELERLRGETMRFSYTTILRAGSFAHYPIDISYQGRHLTATEVMVKNLRSDAFGWYVIAGLNLFIILIFSPLCFAEWIEKFLRERKHQKNRRRKAEKKRAWLEKQEQNEQLPNSKGDKL